jgi:hypothetical protein
MFNELNTYLAVIRVHNSATQWIEAAGGCRNAAKRETPRSVLFTNGRYRAELDF